MSDDETTSKVNTAKLPLHLNLAACYLKLQEVSKSIKNAEKVKKIQKILRNFTENSYNFLKGYGN